MAALDEFRDLFDEFERVETSVEEMIDDEGEATRFLNLRDQMTREVSKLVNDQIKRLKKFEANVQEACESR